MKNVFFPENRIIWLLHKTKNWCKNWSELKRFNKLKQFGKYEWVSQIATFDKVIQKLKKVAWFCYALINVLQYTCTPMYCSIHVLQYTCTTVYMYYSIHVQQYTCTTVYMYYSIHYTLYMYNNIHVLLQYTCTTLTTKIIVTKIIVKF